MASSRQGNCIRKRHKFRHQISHVTLPTTKARGTGHGGVCVNSHPKICTFLQNVWLLMTQKFVPSNEQQEHGGMMKKINMKSTFLAHPENEMVKGDL